MSFKTVLKAALAYLVLALLFTFPLILHMSDSIFGPPEDNFQFVWNFWWVKKALGDSTQALYYTNYLFYPNGLSLYFQSFSFANSFLSLPLQTFLSPWQAYNVLVLLIFAARGLSMFLLARYFVKNNLAAFLAGLIFSFSPFFFHKSLHHLNVSSAHFIPLLILSLYWLRDRPVLRNGLWVGLFLWLNALNCWVYMVFSIFVAGAVLAGFLISNSRQVFNTLFVRSLFAGVAAFVVAISPLLIPLLRELAKGRDYMVVYAKSTHFLDPLLLLLPSDIHPINHLTNNWILRIYNHLPGDNWELNYFVGYSALILTALGIGRLWKQRRFFWIGFGSFFVLISLGYSLHIAGYDLGIPLPYAALAKMPLVKLSRVPGRFFGLALIAISILSAYGFCVVAERIRRRRPGFRDSSLAMGLCAILLIEYLPFPVELTPVSPSCVENRIAADTTCAAVLDIPLWGYASHHKDAAYFEFRGEQYRQTHYVNFPAVYTFRQILHGKRLLDGYGSRIPPEAYDYFAQSSLRALDTMDTLALFDTANITRIREELQKINVGYILLHKDFLRTRTGADIEPRLRFVEQFLTARFERIESDIKEVEVFRVASKQE